MKRKRGGAELGRVGSWTVMGALRSLRSPWGVETECYSPELSPVCPRSWDILSPPCSASWRGLPQEVYHLEGGGSLPLRPWRSLELKVEQSFWQIEILCVLRCTMWYLETCTYCETSAAIKLINMSIPHTVPAGKGSLAPAVFLLFSLYKNGHLGVLIVAQWVKDLTSLWGCGFNPWPRSVDYGSSIASSCCMGLRGSLDPVLPWLWRSPQLQSIPRPLAQELRYVSGVVLKRKKMGLGLGTLTPQR